MKEKTLSDKKIIAQKYGKTFFEDMFYQEDIKEFISKLKKEFKSYLGYSKGTNDVDYIIDKLAGKNLI